MKCPNPTYGSLESEHDHFKASKFDIISRVVDSKFAEIEINFV